MPSRATALVSIVATVALTACHRDGGLRQPDAGGDGGAGIGGAGVGGIVGTGGTSGTAGATDTGGAPGTGGTAHDAGADSLGAGDGDAAPQRTLSFGAAIGYPARTPQFVTAADLNKDGKVDIATVSFDGFAGVLLGNGDGTLQPQRSTSVGGPTNGSAILAGDFNNDGNPDLAVALARFGFSILLGRGDGTFASGALGISGTTEGGLAAADFNHDGKLDVVLPIDSAGGVSVANGKGDGSFEQFPPVYETTLHPLGAVARDFNRDGILDIATAGGGAVGMLLGKADGTFPLTGITFPATGGDTIRSLAAGDFNADGVPDVVVPDSNGIEISVLLGKDDGTLLGATKFPAGSNPTDVAVADLDLDGKLDIVVTNDVGPVNTGMLAVLHGKGDGTFESFRVFSTGMGPHSVAIADLNGDGAPDLTVANKDDGSVSVLLNTSR